MIAETVIAGVMARQARRSLFFTEGPGTWTPAAPSRPIHLYIHVPFCVRLCPYCSFHRVVFREDAARSYFHALRTEIARYADMGFLFSSVYVGGGTPTILMDELGTTLELVNKRFSPHEISVETNPDRLDRENLERLAGHGVRRVSVGVQSFCDEILRSVGRYETYGSGEALARRLVDCRGIVETLNVDMIYDFPIQTEAMLAHDLSAVRSVMPDQVTFYPLMVSDATRVRMDTIMGRRSRKNSRRFHDLIADALEDAYTPNSAWCFSKGGATMVDEYVVGGLDYIGAGSGSLGLVDRTAYANTFSLERYVGDIASGLLPIAHHRRFSTKELARYHLLMTLFGLRMDMKDFERRFGRSPWRLVGPEILFFLLARGLRIGRGTLELTRRGRFYWVVMMREFFSAVDTFRDQGRAATCSDPDRP